MKRRIQAVKGTRDILPTESALWNQVENTARKVLSVYNFQEVRLPLFEETELFARSVGAETDIVSKEMYSFPDYPSKRLGSLRTTILARPVVKKTKASLYMIHRLVGEFLSELRTIPPAELPQTAANACGLGDLEDLYRQFREEYKKPGRFPERLAGLGNEMRETLRSIELGPEVTLRPEATASVVRAYIEHGMHTQPGLTKLYYIGPMFRRERPQKGRFRQFYQIGAEVLGQSDAPAIDAEIIEVVLDFIERCGLKGAALYLNSIGDANCRPKYVDLLRKELVKVKSKLGPDSQRRIETNPLRVLDSKLEEEQPVIGKLPSILDHLCPACREHFDVVKRELEERDIRYEINWRLVRGLDYYMRTTFEITAPGLGAQNAVCGGGRYDGLVELLGGPKGIKGIGWALGTDRLVLALEQTKAVQAPKGLDVYLVWLGPAARSAAVRLARRLRGQRVATEVVYEETKLRKALELANKANAAFAVIIGDEELVRNQFTLRDMKTGTQRALSETELLERLTGTTDLW